MDYSAFFKLDKNDLIKGLYVAVIVGVLGVLQQLTQDHGLDFASYDWMGIADVAWKSAVAYLGKNLLTDSSGMPLGTKNI